MENVSTRQAVIFSLAVIVITLAFSVIAPILFDFSPKNTSSLVRWDAVHYLKLAVEGYKSTGEDRFLYAFFPLYPLATSLLNIAVNNALASSLIISAIAFILSSILLFKLARIDYNPDISFQAVFLLAIFPTAYFLHLPYTESLFLLLILGSFYFARKQNWLAASSLAGLATATRITGLALIPALVVEYLQQKNFNPRKINKDALFILLSLAGITAYLYMNYSAFGNPFQFVEFQSQHWFKNPSLPIEGAKGAWESMFWRADSEKLMVGAFELLFGIASIALLLYGVIKRVRTSYLVYAILAWLLTASVSFWLSMPRYALTLFPIFFILAIEAQSQLKKTILAVLFITIQAIFFLMYLKGAWAF